MGAFLIPDNFVRRSDLRLESAARYSLDPTLWKVWDAPATTLPATSANDDLGIYDGTFGTEAPYIATSDLKTAGATTRYARFQFILPPEYVAAGAVTLVLKGLTSAVADDSSTVDVVCHRVNLSASGEGSDICATALQSINSATAAEKSFTITSTNLSPGDILDIRVAITVTDAAGGSPVIARISRAYMSLDVRG